MARHHATGKGDVPFTPEEEAIADAHDAEQAALPNQKILKLIEIEGRAAIEKRKPMIVGRVPVRNLEKDIAKIHGTAVKDVQDRVWKTGLGTSLKLSIPEMKAVRDAVHDREQSSFDEEMRLSDLVNATTTLSALNLIDIDSSWPTIGT